MQFPHLAPNFGWPFQWLFRFIERVNKQKMLQWRQQKRQPRAVDGYPHQKGGHYLNGSSNRLRDMKRVQKTSTLRDSHRSVAPDEAAPVTDGKIANKKKRFRHPIMSNHNKGRVCSCCCCTSFLRGPRGRIASVTPCCNLLQRGIRHF